MSVKWGRERGVFIVSHFTKHHPEPDHGPSMDKIVKTTPEGIGLTPGLPGQPMNPRAKEIGGYI